MDVILETVGALAPMAWVLALAALGAGALIGAYWGGLPARGRAAGLAEDLSSERARAREMGEDLRAAQIAAAEAGRAETAAATRAEGLAGQLGELRAKAEVAETSRAAAIEAKARIEAEMKERTQAHAREIERLNKLHGELKKEFESLAAKTFESNQHSFLKLANEVFAKHRETAAGQSEQHRAGLEKLIQPMAEQLKRYEDGLKAYDTERQRSFTELKTELKQVVGAQERVAGETARLVNALRASPKTRGRWGEEQLRNILEMAGMTRYVDFETEKSVRAGDSLLRPDALLRLPGGRALVIDAKTATNAYLDAHDADDEALREECLQRHARQMRRHMEELGNKRYFDQFEQSPDFVVMFVPGENFLAAAAEKDPSLFQDAYERNVVITTPATLIALAKAVAYGWRQESLAENARHVAGLGRELYGRLAAMGKHVAQMGGSLDSAVDKYNKLVGSLETSVMPQARKFVELDVASSEKDITLLEPVERDVREPRRGRDLDLDGHAAEPDIAMVPQVARP